MPDAELAVTGRVFALRNIRIYFAKKGRLKFVSHLDMTRFMARIITKSKISIWYTEGFNQHIYMNFALPLSLGYEGLYEIMDFRLIDDNYSIEDCLESLKKVSPPDIEFLKIRENFAPMKEIAFAEYIMDFETLSDEAALKLSEFLKRESIICSKKGKKGKIREIDIAPKIKSFNIENNSLKLILTAGNENTLNPSLVLDAFFEACEIPQIFYTVKRTMVFNEKLEEFE